MHPLYLHLQDRVKYRLMRFNVGAPAHVVRHVIKRRDDVFSEPTRPFLNKKLDLTEGIESLLCSVSLTQVFNTPVFVSVYTAVCVILHLYLEALS